MNFVKCIGRNLTNQRGKKGGMNMMGDSELLFDPCSFVLIILVGEKQEDLLVHFM